MAQSILHNLVGPNKPDLPDLSSRVAVVTGGALGIGYEISRALAASGCRVIMLNRKAEQGSEAIATIKAESPQANIEWRALDLSSLSMTRDVFTGLTKELNRLDFLVCNAGINANQFELDSDGIDRHFGVNFLGQFYAVNLLWPLLRKTGSTAKKGEAPRVVFESSEMHRTAPGDVKFESLEEINNDKLGPVQLYGRTKLAQILFAKYGLAQGVVKKNEDNVWTASVHPGTVNTEAQKQWPEAYPGIPGKLLMYATQLVGRDVEQGAQSALWALTAPEIEEKGMNGYYFTDPSQEGKETEQASDEKLAKNLWNLSEKIITDKLGKNALGPWNK